MDWGRCFKYGLCCLQRDPSKAVQFWAVGSRRKATFLSLWRESPNMLQIIWFLGTSLGSGPLRFTRFLAQLLPHTCFIKTFKALVIPAHQVQSSWYHQYSGWEWSSVECGDFCTWAITEIRDGFIRCGPLSSLDFTSVPRKQRTPIKSSINPFGPNLLSMKTVSEQSIIRTEKNFIWIKLRTSLEFLSQMTLRNCSREAGFSARFYILAEQRTLNKSGLDFFKV